MEQAKLQRQEEEEAQPKLQRQEEEEAQTKLQRQEEEEEEQAQVQRQEEEEPQARLQRQEEEEEAQPKLQRQEEEEAQAKLQRQKEEEPQPKLQRQEEEKAQAKLQRQEEEVQSKPEARAKLRDKRQFPVLNSVEQQIFDSKGKGEKLDDDTRISMETGFGADFGGVRVHHDSLAQAMSRELRAQAFTHGKDIYFASGKFEPESARGRNLLAHELTHVVQQGAAEQRVSPQQIGRNNARRTEPIPEPTDKAALQTQEATQERIQKNEPALGEGPPGEGPQVSSAKEPGAAGVPEGEPKKEAGSASKEKGSEKKGAPAAKKGRGKKKVARKGKAAAAAGAVSAFLRKMTQPAFESKKKKVAQLAANEKTKDPADAKLAQTEKAVVPPAEEAGSQAKASQVSTVEQAPEPQPDEQQAKDQFQSAMEQAVPSTLEEVDKFKEEGKGRIVGEKVKEVVTADSQQVKGTYQEIENPPEPKPPDQNPEELPEMETAPETASLDLGDGVVGEVQHEHTDLSEFDQQSEEMLQKEGIKEEYLDMVDEGDLAEARKERQSVKTKAKEGPKEVKTFEQQESQKVSKELKKEELEGKQKMKEERQEELTGAREDQKKTKTGIEQKRLEVTNHINGIYETANTTVKQKLEDLEKKSLKDFDEGEKKATKSFEDEVKKRIDAFKKRRYDRFGGSLLWAKDKLFGMDDLPEVKQIFDTEKNRFITSIDALIVKITAENKRVIQECKELVANARMEIEKFVQGLGPELGKTGQEGLQQMKGKLDALDKKINDKEKELKKKLEAKREAAIKAIEEKIEKMKEEMSGLISKLGNLLLNAMVKFFKWALKKAGYASDQLMGILNKGKAVIKKIVTDPIGFIKNIVTAVKNGIGMFQKNIKKHLIGGLISWLTGAMADVPITLPTKFDLRGILSLVLQILGLTWDRIRKKLVKRLGEKVVKIAETSVAIIKKLITEGPMSLWEMIKAKAAKIKQQVMSGIRNWIIVQVVKQGIIKLLSFLNPAGAIVQAILAIYNTIMFFVENWDRMVQFVKTVFGSIADIAVGKLSAAAQAVERVLAMTIPIILNFMARLLGLSGIGKTITRIIAKIRKPIDKVVNKVIDSVAKLAKKLAGKGKGKKKGKAADLQKHAAIGRKVVKQLSKAGAKGALYEKLRKDKEKQARALEAKYNPKLKKPVKMKISFRPPKEDRKDGDLDFHVHIGPNDFQIDGAAEGIAGGVKPLAGLHGVLKKQTGPKQQESHHVPPKGLLGWMQGQADASKAKLGTVPPAHSWLKLLAGVPKATYDPGDPLAAIAVNKHTHIKKLGNQSDLWRAHFGKNTAIEVFHRMKGKTWKPSIEVASVSSIRGIKQNLSG